MKKRMRPQNPLASLTYGLDAQAHPEEGKSLADTAFDRSAKNQQTNMINSCEMPAKHNGKKYSLENLKDMGFEFGDLTQRGEMIEAKLPPGWEKKATDHHMWSRIIDERGSERISIFVKYQFSFLEDAFFNIKPRFRIEEDFYQMEKLKKDEGIERYNVEHFTYATQYCVKDYVQSPDGRLVYRSKLIMGSSKNRNVMWKERDKAEKEAESECRSWLGQKLGLGESYDHKKHFLMFWDGNPIPALQSAL